MLAPVTLASKPQGQHLDKPSSARYGLRYAFAEQFIETCAGREPAGCKSAESEPYNIAYKALSAI